MPRLVATTPIDKEDLCWKKCGREYDYGCHGVRGADAYTEKWCSLCYTKALKAPKRGQKTEAVAA